MSEFLAKQPRRVLTVAVSEWASLRPECLPANVTCEPGFELELLSMMARILNFQMEFVRSKVAGCGEHFPNGTWSGVLGMVQSGVADITGNLCTVNEERSTHLNHTWPVNYDSRVFLIKAPESVFIFRSDQFKLGAPFNRQLWYILLAILLVYITIFMVSMYFRFASFSRAIVETIKETIALTMNMDSKYMNFHLFVYSAVVGFTLLIYSTFIMTALLSPVTISAPFSNQMEVNDKLYDGKYRLVSYQTSPRNCYGNCDKFYQALSRNGYDTVPSLIDQDESTKLMDHIVNSHKSLFINTDRAAKALLDSYRFRSKLWLIYDETSTSVLYSYFLQKGFRFKKLIDESIIFLDSAKYNIQDRYRGLWKQVQTEKKITGEISDKISIGVGLVSGPIVYCGVGIVMSFISLAVEILIYRFGRT